MSFLFFVLVVFVMIKVQKIPGRTMREKLQVIADRWAYRRRALSLQTKRVGSLLNMLRPGAMVSSPMK